MDREILVDIVTSFLYNLDEHNEFLNIMNDSIYSQDEYDLIFDTLSRFEENLIFFEDALGIILNIFDEL